MQVGGVPGLVGCKTVVKSCRGEGVGAWVVSGVGGEVAILVGSGPVSVFAEFADWDGVVHTFGMVWDVLVAAELGFRPVLNEVGWEPFLVSGFLSLVVVVVVVVCGSGSPGTLSGWVW